MFYLKDVQLVGLRNKSSETSYCFPFKNMAYLYPNFTASLFVETYAFSRKCARLQFYL